MIGGSDEEGSYAFVAGWAVRESVSGVYLSTICLVELRVSGDEDED